MNLTDEEIERLKELLAKATPGPWRAERGNAGSEHPLFLITGTRGGRRMDSDEDVELIAESRNHLPAMLAEIEAKREKVEISNNSGRESFDEGVWTLFSCACGCDQIERDHKFCPHCGKGIEWK